MKNKKKALADTNHQSFNPNTLSQFKKSRDKMNELSVFNCTENVNILQCNLCNPQLHSKGKTPKVCVNCQVSNARLASELFEHLKQNRKIIKLQRCFACNRSFAPLKFSTYFGICKACLNKRDESVPARRKFAARAINNINNILREALAL